MTDWKQTAQDMSAILCDAGDLLRECNKAFLRNGDKAMAETVRKFCARVHRCMDTGTKWEETK